ncbi:IS4 family transposase [Desulfonatronospira sp.]|uniref:IS4 family transposase n=1 Tax=Desulfonatronospira sp. TaxID=1962951 RepID=UPI0025BAC033|nr:IS4 family transposase [Desulfonatronospira sp.]
METQTLEQACERLDRYAKRWGVEVYRRTLKSGCRIEDRQLETTDSLEACLAMDMVVAWQIFHLTRLAREIPNAPCTVYFEDAEWKTLYILATNSVDFPKQEPTLREAVRMMGSQGGHPGRKSDGEPGTTTLWRAFVLLHGGLIVYRALMPNMKRGP